MKRRLTVAITFALSLCILSSADVARGQGAAARVSAPQTLGPSLPVERQIKGGETQAYQFKLGAGQYARAEVEQNNIDLVVSLFAPDGGLLLTLDGKDGRMWREAVSASAGEAGGMFRVEVKAYGSANVTGSYRVKLGEIRQTAAQDRRRMEAERLLSSGRSFYLQGGAKRLDAIREYESAAKIWQEVGDEEWLGVTLANLGWTYLDLSKGEPSADNFSRAADLFKKTNDRMGESKAANGLGIAWLDLNQYDKAKDYFEKALAIKREIGDRRGIERVLTNLGSVYWRLSKFEKARDSYVEALEIAKEIKERADEGSLLHSLGGFYQDLVQNERARDYYEQAVAIFRETNDRHAEGVTLNNLGNVYRDLGQPEKAREALERTLAIVRDEKDRKNEGRALHNLANVYRDIGQSEKARDLYEQALVIRRELKDLRGEGYTLHNLGLIYIRWEQFEKARDYFEQALVVATEAKDSDVESYPLMHLMILSDWLNKPQAAIFYGKRVINIFQTIRGNIKNLDKETQDGFLKSKIYYYRYLANLLIEQGRLQDAQDVLDLLKEEEYRQVGARRGGGNPDTVPYGRAESDVIAKIEALAALTRRQRELQTLLRERGSISAAEQRELDQVLTDIEVANRAFRESLEALKKPEYGVGPKVDEIKSERNLQRALGQWNRDPNSGVVAIYTVIGTEEGSDKDAAGMPAREQTRSKFGWAILVTPEGHKAYPIDVKDLEYKVFVLRAALSSEKYDPQLPASKLYDAIFRQTSEKQKTTLEADLAETLGKYKDKTIMWSLDGVLRYVPMAALHDGDGYLVEKYRHIVFTKQSLLLLNEPDSEKWQALGLGLSDKREGFEPLPGAEKELRDIVRQPQSSTGIFDGTIKLNGDFKKDETLRLWREGKYPLIHIASHYSFNALEQADSFLLVGDGKLTFADLQDKENLFGAVDLLTLSACDTGMSANGRESESFAHLAQSLGAKSVIASLWKVADAGTPELMIHFYKLRAANPHMPKGEAFRQAQLALLGADVRKETDPQSKESQRPAPTRAEIVNAGGVRVALPLFVKDEKRPFAHPYFWSAFVLIGNWR